MILALAAFVVVGGSVVAMTPAWSDPIGPSLTVTPPAAPAGSKVVVKGQGFPSYLGTLELEVCGNHGLGGSPDCNRASALTTAENGGTFAVSLLIANPPVPCPCVISADAPELPAAVMVPFTVVGAPAAQAPLVSPAQTHSGLAVEQASLQGSNSLGAWFGAAPRRTLLLRVRNAGNVAAASPPLLLTAGKGPNPDTTVPAPDLGTIAPGQVITYSIPIAFQPFSFGTYTVKGQVGPAWQLTTFTTKTSLWPWGLVGVVGVLIGLILWWIRNRVRNYLRWRRRRRAERRALVGVVSAREDASRSEQAVAGGDDGPASSRTLYSEHGRQTPSR